MPFRGLLSTAAEKAISHTDFREVVLSWLPAWWLSLAISFAMTGFAVACSIWAAIAGMEGYNIGTPLLLGAAAVITAIGNALVPMVSAWFKDRAESRENVTLKKRVLELESKLHVVLDRYQANKEHVDALAEMMKKKQDKPDDRTEPQSHP